MSNPFPASPPNRFGGNPPSPPSNNPEDEVAATTYEERTQYRPDLGYFAPSHPSPPAAPPPGYSPPGYASPGYSPPGYGPGRYAPGPISYGAPGYGRPPTWPQPLPSRKPSGGVAAILGVCLVILAAIGFFAFRFFGSVAVYKLTAGDKAEFQEHSNAFISANNNLQTTLNVNTDATTIQESSEDDLLTMETELDGMKELAKKLNGEPKEIADELVAAAEKIYVANSDFVNALISGNTTQIITIGAQGQTAITEFNAAADKWNALSV